MCRADLEPGIAESVLHGAGTILVVEDEAFVREVLGEILRSAGYRVLVARNAAEARIMFHHDREEI